MSSTPLICCSNGDATVSAITRGLAPGYVARTTTVGGTTCGYSLIGSWKRAMAPATTITSDNTAAKIGRSTKSLENFIQRSIRCGFVDGHGRWQDLALGLAGRHVDNHGCDLRARAYALQTVDDDRFARGNP